MKVCTSKPTLETAMAPVRVSSAILSANPPHIIPVNETAVIRWAYGDPVIGTCKESIQGGNHFRYWIQDGSNASRCVNQTLLTVPNLTIPAALLCSWPLRTSCLLRVRAYCL
jgi:hypothetical protein